MRKILLLTTLAFIFLESPAQYTRYIVRLKDKADNPFSISNPSQYLSQRAIDRRQRYNILIDSLDLPVTPRYVDSIRLSGAVTILNVSRWLNQVAIETTDDAALTKINALPFVISSAPIASRPSATAIIKFPQPGLQEAHYNSDQQRLTEYYDYGASSAQVKIHNTDFLHNHGFRGENMHLAMLDAGFYHYLTLPTFDSIRSNNQILGTWDFIEMEENVDDDHSHGMQCLSTIAANMPGIFVGSAPKTSFYLFKTEEINSEYPIEEQNWVAGAEKADSLGVDVISSSLGYDHFDDAVFDYPYSAMDGNTTISARGADVAAKKGILVLNSAGNDGSGPIHYINTPADADSILTVGAVDTLGNVAGFSSYGPTSDGQIKPNVAAVGLNAVVARSTTGLPLYSSGTSFSCPIMAGVATCLWQAYPEVNNMTIIEALQASGTRANNPDDRVGYGIPDAKFAFVYLQKRSYSRQPVFINNCMADIEFSVKADNSMSVDLERKLATDTGYTIVSSQIVNGDFTAKNVVFNNDLSSQAAGIVKYRIKMNIDVDTSYYLDSFFVDHSENCGVPTDAIEILQPYPYLDIVYVRTNFSVSSALKLIIQNSIGQRVYANSYDQSPGISYKNFYLTNLSRGIYFISVFRDGKKIMTKKILKQ
jgi:serine protease AprX